MDLVAAELDYPLVDFTSQIIESIKAYAETIQAGNENLEVSD